MQTDGIYHKTEYSFDMLKTRTTSDGLIHFFRLLDINGHRISAVIWDKTPMFQDGDYTTIEKIVPDVCKYWTPF